MTLYICRAPTGFKDHILITEGDPEAEGFILEGHYTLCGVELHVGSMRSVKPAPLVLVSCKRCVQLEERDRMIKEVGGLENITWSQCSRCMQKYPEGKFFKAHTEECKA